MSKVFSDKALLIFGIVLLFITLGFQVYTSGSRQNLAAEPAKIVNREHPCQKRTVQIFNGALMGQHLYWEEAFTVTDEDNNLIKLNTILGDKNKLVFRFGELSCSACVEREISYLKQMAEKIGNENVVFLASYTSIRDLMIFKRINKIPFKVYNVSEQNLSADGTMLTLLFIGNAKNGAFMPFIPDKEDAEMSLAYYEAILPVFSAVQ